MKKAALFFMFLALAAPVVLNAGTDRVVLAELCSATW
jgi:hypothetical protein